MNFKKELEKITLSEEAIKEVSIVDDVIENARKAMIEIAREEQYKQLEIVFNSNHLKGIRNKLDGVVTFFGVDCDFTPLEKDLSFIVRPIMNKQKKKESLNDYSNAELIKELNNRLDKKI